MSNKNDGLDYGFLERLDENKRKRDRERQQKEKEVQRKRDRENQEWFDSINKHSEAVAIEKQKKEEQKRKQKEEILFFDSVNRNYNANIARKKAEEAEKRQKKRFKKKIINLFVKTATAGTLIAGASWGAIQVYKICRGEAYIVDKVEELNVTGNYNYYDASSLNYGEEMKKNPYAPYIRRGGKGPESLKFYNFEEASELMEMFNRVIIDGGYPEEWTPVYIESTIGTSRFSDQFKGGDSFEQIKTKLEAYDMMKQEEKEQKEGISR